MSVEGGKDSLVGEAPAQTGPEVLGGALLSLRAWRVFGGSTAKTNALFASWRATLKGCNLRSVEEADILGSSLEQPGFWGYTLK